MTSIDDDLRAALTAPMEEPTWPGAPVIAACSGGTRESLHVRRIGEDFPNWECWECDCFCSATKWHLLSNPRPLTPAEYEKYGIPEPCTHGADEETAQRAEGTTP